MTPLSIRLATKNDIPIIVSIYNEFIDTTITMDTTLVTVESRSKWFNEHSPEHPITCFVTDTGIIAGWSSLSKWSEKLGYKRTVENSLYVARKFQHAGIGTKLLKDSIIRAKNLGYHCIVSRIDAENTISLSLHEKYGFQNIGIMKEFGFKFNKYIDIVILQLLL